MGNLVKGAETNKQWLQNKRQHHALQYLQLPTTMWMTHTETSFLLPKHEHPIDYRNKMCPTGIVTSHPAGELLAKWSQLGCPTKTGQP
jgi:hypothetical protein